MNTFEEQIRNKANNSDNTTQTPIIGPTRGNHLSGAMSSSSSSARQLDGFEERIRNKSNSANNNGVGEARPGGAISATSSSRLDQFEE